MEKVEANATVDGKIFKLKCFRCEYIECIDFFRKLGKFEGNELFVLGATVNSKKSCCASFQVALNVFADLH
ncbi:MAG: hypothetical protein J7L07_04240 [Candidatus Odinarchaeota archaeon]|nr:hypothetical protein [Candidatus Odinarchaeota archaeon]